MPCDRCKRDVDHLDGKLKCLFRHMNSSFRRGVTIVHIADSHCCEKCSSCAGTENIYNIQDRSANSVDTVSGSHEDAIESSASERAASRQRTNSRHHRDREKNADSSFSLEESGDDSPSEGRYLQSDHDKGLLDLCVFSTNCYLTPEQKVELSDLVKKIQPGLPVLVAQMKKSNVRRYGPSLGICKGYAIEYFPEGSQGITLERPGWNKKKWHVGLYVKPNGGGHILCRKWSNFVRDNHLKENDICVFQPVKGKGVFRLMVHLLQDACTPSPSGHAHRPKKCRRRKATLTAHSQGIKYPSSDSHGRQIAQEPSDGSGGPSRPPPFVVLGSTRLTPEQDKIVEDKVKAIESEVLIFVATMNKKIVGDNHTFSLDFSTQYAAPHLPEGKITLTLRQNEWSKAWCVAMHNRQVIDVELREFAQDNRLLAGDLCLFEPLENERLAMRVHIIRREQYL